MLVASLIIHNVYFQPTQFRNVYIGLIPKTKFTGLYQGGSKWPILRRHQFMTVRTISFAFDKHQLTAGGKENIEPRPLMTFETPLLYCVPAPMKEKDTGAVTLPSGSDPTNVPSTSPYKYANPIYLLSTSQAPNGIETRKAQVPPSSLLKDGNLEYFVSSSEPPSNVETSNTDSASADEILSTVAHLSDSEPSNDIETINTDSASIDEVVSTINYISDCESPNGNGIFLHIDPDHTDQLSELDSELYSESTNVIPKTFEWFPDLPAEVRIFSDLFLHFSGSFQVIVPLSQKIHGMGPRVSPLHSYCYRSGDADFETLYRSV